MPVIDCQKLEKRFGDRAILGGVTLTIRRAERVGLVGLSGCGKSTLGRILGGIETPDSGEISLRRGARVDVLEQDPRFPADQSVRDVVLGSLVEWRSAKQAYDAATDALAHASEGEIDSLVHQQAEAGEAVERLGGWERIHEAESIVDHLGIRDASRQIGSLSGGERRRVALARLLVGEPDLAILDEPTNHLDVETIEWLEDYLRERFRGALVLITHDRYVLDNVATRTLELHDGELDSYDGGYATYLAAKAERHAHAERVESNRQNFLRRELEWLRRGPKARATKQKARIGRAHEALAQDAPQQERAAVMRAETTRQGKTILQFKNLDLERGGQVLVRNLDLSLSAGDRIGIVGPNGAGKTSLLLCLQGELEPSAGVIEVGKTTRVGYLDQARSGLDPNATLREACVGDRDSIEIGGEMMRAGAYLEQFLFDGTAQRKKISVLSGGERSRVCLAKLLCEKSNLLLLDEPTNDLDVSTLGALEAMLLEYKGSALIVSHDRWFLDRIATAILVFEPDGRLDLHRGNYSDYRTKREAELRRAAVEKRAKRPASPGKPRKQSDPEKTPTSPPKKLTFKEVRELDGLMDRIETIDTEIQELETKLADPAIYKAGGSEIAELSGALDAARAQGEKLLARWEELESRREANSG